jgi:hypothetical protein
MFLTYHLAIQINYININQVGQCELGKISRFWDQNNYLKLSEWNKKIYHLSRIDLLLRISIQFFTNAIFIFFETTGDLLLVS